MLSVAASRVLPSSLASSIFTEELSVSVEGADAEATTVESTSAFTKDSVLSPTPESPSALTRSFALSTTGAKEDPEEVPTSTVASESSIRSEAVFSDSLIE